MQAMDPTKNVIGLLRLIVPPNPRIQHTDRLGSLATARSWQSGAAFTDILRLGDLGSSFLPQALTLAETANKTAIWELVRLIPHRLYSLTEAYQPMMKSTEALLYTDFYQSFHASIFPRISMAALNFGF